MPIGIPIGIFCKGSEPGSSSNARKVLTSLSNIFLMVLVWQLGQPFEVKPKPTRPASRLPRGNCDIVST